MLSNEETWLALLPWESKNRCLLLTTLNVMAGFFLLFDVTMDISHGKFISGKSGHTHHAKLPHVKGSFTTVKVSRVTAPNIMYVKVKVEHAGLSYISSIFIYASKIYVRTHLKTLRQSKSTLTVAFFFLRLLPFEILKLSAISIWFNNRLKTGVLAWTLAWNSSIGFLSASFFRGVA